MGDSRKADDNLSWTDMLREARMLGKGGSPEGWETTRQIAEGAGLSVSHTNKLLGEAIAQGKAEREMFPLRRADRIQPVPHYRMIE